MSRRSSAVLDPATPAGSRSQRARTQPPAMEPSVLAADAFVVNLAVEEEAALHVEHTAHGGEFKVGGVASRSRSGLWV